MAGLVVGGVEMVVEADFHIVNLHIVDYVLVGSHKVVVIVGVVEVVVGMVEAALARVVGDVEGVGVVQIVED